MAFAPEPYNYVNGGAGLLLAGLGAYVMTRQPIRRPNALFGLFMVMFGLGYFVNHFVFSFSSTTNNHVWAAPLPFWGSAAILLIPVALQFPSNLQLGSRPAALLVAVATAISLAAVWSLYLPPRMEGLERDGLRWLGAGGYAAFSGLIMVLFGASLLFALRYLRSNDPREQRRLAIVGVALGVYLASVAGSGTHTLDASIWSSRAYFVAWSVINLVWAAWIICAWVAAALRTSDSKAAWVVAGVWLAVTLVGLFVAYRGDEIFGLRGPFHGIARIVAFIILVYGILRDDLLGIDLTAKVTTKYGLLTGTWIALFFLVSEGAAELLSNQLGPYLGLAGASILVFALTPLHRAADHVGRQVAALPDDVEFFRQQLVLAWRDGTLQVRERRLLQNLQTRLRIDDATALELENQVLAGRGPVVPS